MDMKEALQRRAEPHVCTAAVIVRNGKLLLGNRVYPEKDLSVWNFPGGRCDENETVEDTLKREVLEEIGIEYEKLEIIDFMGEIKGSWKDDTVMVFYCSIDGEPTLMEPEKFKKWEWFKIEEGLKTHFNNEAIELVRNYLKNKE